MFRFLFNPHVNGADSEISPRFGEVFSWKCLDLEFFCDIIVIARLFLPRVDYFSIHRNSPQNSMVSPCVCKARHEFSLSLMLRKNSWKEWTMIDIERTLLVCPIEIVVHFFVISGGFTMKKKVLKQMQELSDCGYVFTRVTDQYQCEQLLPDQMDATLDSVIDTPAYQHVPSMWSAKRTFFGYSTTKWCCR